MPSWSEKHLAHWELGAVSLAVAVAVVAALVARLPYGVGLTDEAFYVAIPYRFWLGDRPFVDEVLIFQTAGLLIQPLIAGFLALRGGTDGLMLFVRGAYLVFSLGTAALVAVALARAVRWQHALPIALLAAAFVPFCIPGLSYNTLGILFFTAGLALSSCWLLSPEARWLARAGSVLLVLAALAYPPLVLPAVVHAALATALGRRRGHDFLRPFLQGAAPSALAVGALLASFGLDNLIRCVAVTASTGLKGGGTAKLVLLAGGLADQLIAHPLPGLCAAAAGLALRAPGAGARRIAAGLMLAFPFTLGTVDVPWKFELSLSLMLHASLLALFTMSSRLFEGARRDVALAIAVPSFAAAAVASYTSSNGIGNLGLFLLPAVVVSGLALVSALEPPEREEPTLASLVPLVPTTLLLLLVLRSYTGAAYWENDLGALTASVKSGPFAGLRTRPEQVAFVEELQRDLDRTVKPDDRILFYDDLSAGYLMTAARPATNSVWMPSPVVAPGAPASLLEHYERGSARPTVVVRNLATVVPADHPVDAWVQRAFEPTVAREHYRILRARPESE